VLALFCAAAQAQLPPLLPHAKRPAPPAHPELTRTIKGNMETYTDFYSPSLGGTRTVHVLLPEGYNSSDQSYPTLYMLDGQNLFSPKSSPYGKCWHVPEILSTLYATGKMKKVVLVAIDAGAERMKDYTPFIGIDRDGAGGGAEAYSKFLSRDLVLFMETNYRLLRGPENRAIAGSSLGGIMALYLMSKHPDMFSMAIAMSPAIGWNPQGVSDMIKNAKFSKDARIWMDTGMLEGDYADGVMSEPLMFARLETQMLSSGLVYGKNLLAYMDADGIHDEGAWGRRLPMPLRWMFGKEDMAVRSIDAQTSASALGITKPSPSTLIFRGRIKFKGGIEADYIPPQAKAAPPYLTWDGAFLLASGAEPVSVKLSSDYAGKKFSSSVQLVRDLPAECEANFEVTAPAGLPADAKLFAAGSLPQLGGWKTSGIELKRDAANPRLWRATVRFPRGAGGAYKFNSGSLSAAEKDAAGADIGDRALLCDRSAITVRAEIARFGAK
jgi:predicted alpha/beta superfamily hydrolase